MKLWFKDLLNSYSSTARKTQHPLLEAALHGADKRARKTRRRPLGNLFFKRRAVASRR